MDLTLILMAAGLGSRFGGLKQLLPCGPNDETIAEYSIYDGLKAGFNKFVFIIRKETEDKFKENLFSKLPSSLNYSVVYQELDSGFPSKFSLPLQRKKPWGTGHALLSARDIINEPFCVANADDYYGPEAFSILADFFKKDESRFALVGYKLKNTLSTHGSVSRAICDVDASGNLASIVEHTTIAKDTEGNLVDLTNEREGYIFKFTGNETTSLNLWGFRPNFFPFLNIQFELFLENSISDPKAEFYLPAAVDAAINQDIAQVAVLPTTESWFGITYADDYEDVKSKLTKKIEAGLYPERLWENF